jgi:hypothetical protein
MLFVHKVNAAPIFGGQEKAGGLVWVINAREAHLMALAGVGVVNFQHTANRLWVST